MPSRPAPQRFVNHWRAEGLTRPLVLRRTRKSALMWHGAVVVGILVAALCTWFMHHLVVVIGFGNPPPIFGNPVIGVAVAAFVGLLVFALGLFILIYALITLYVLILESRHGFLTLTPEGFSSPSFFNAFVPWHSIWFARVIEDRLLNVAMATFPLILIDRRRAVQARLSWLDRQLSHVFALYSAWYACERDDDFAAALDARPQALATSILSDSSVLDDYELVEIFTTEAQRAGAQMAIADHASGQDQSVTSK